MPTILYVGSPSRFVTATAWVALVLATAVAVLAGWQLPGLAGVAAAGLALAQAASAVGLMLRLEGARRAFIGCAAVGVAALLAVLWWQAGQLPLPAIGAATVLAPVLAAWVVRRLNSARIRQEFSCA